MRKAFTLFSGLILWNLHLKAILSGDENATKIHKLCLQAPCKSLKHLTSNLSEEVEYCKKANFNSVRYYHFSKKARNKIFQIDIFQAISRKFKF